MPIQRDLFGNVVSGNAPDAPIIEITLLSPKERKETMQWIDGYNLKHFKPLAERFVDICRHHCVRTRTKDGQLEPVHEIVAMLKSKSNKPKAQWVEFLALFFNRKNFHVLTDTFSPPMLKLWKAVLRDLFVSEQTANAIMGEECFGFRKALFNFSYKTLKEPYEPYFCSVAGRGEGEMAQFVTMFSASWLQHLRLFTPDYDDDSQQEDYLEELPEDDTLMTYSAEGVMLSSMRAITAVLKTANIPCHLEKIPVTLTRRIHKVFPVPALFPSATDTLLQEWAQYMAARIAVFCFLHTSADSGPMLRFKLAAMTCMNDAYYTLPILLPHLKGLKKSSDYGFSHRGQRVTDGIIHCLKRDAQMGWIPASRLLHFAQTASVVNGNEATEGNELSNFLLHAPDDLNRMRITNTFSGNDVSNGRFVSDIAVPYVQSTLFMLALLGLVDIAYHMPAPGAPSPYSGLRYVRVNDLGLHVLGLTDKYIHTTVKKKSFELDKEHLIVRSCMADNPFNVFLDDMAVKLTPTLYRMDFESLFRKCKTKADVANAISTFKQYISSKWPPIWKDFFNEALERCQMFQTPEEQYMAFRIPEADKELQRLVLTQPELRKFVIKAESYTLVLKASDYTAFGKALRKFGYVFT